MLHWDGRDEPAHVHHIPWGVNPATGRSWLSCPYADGAIGACTCGQWVRYQSFPYGGGRWRKISARKARRILARKSTRT